MRKGFLGSLATLCAGAGIAVGGDQAPPAVPPPPAVVQVAPDQGIKPLPPAGGAPVHAQGEGCAPTVCCPLECEDGNRFWGSGEYLLWWFKDAPNPVPLVTRGSAANALPGVPGQLGTAILYGGNAIDYGAISGGRLTLGYWLTPEQRFGLETRGLLTEQRSELFSVGSNGAGTPLIGRPMFDLLTGAAFPFSTSFPGSLSGGDVISASSRLWGAEINGVASVVRDAPICVDLLTGFRYLDLGEDISISETSVALGPTDLTFRGAALPTGAITNSRDRFQTRNQFYGAQLGAKAGYRRGNAFLDLAARLGLGSTHQTVTVAGISDVRGPGVVPASAPGGVLAVPSNSGRFTRNEFSVLPEVEVRVGYNFTQSIGAFIGYNFLYWSDVARPGDQIPNNGTLAVANRSQIPTSGGFGAGGPAGPPTVIQDSDFWAQGINLGLEFRY